MSGDSEAVEWLRDGARRSIRSYRSADITFRRLIDDLDAIWTNFEQSAWSENFRSQWWVLEEIYAVALDRGDMDELSRQDQQAIVNALNELDKLLG